MGPRIAHRHHGNRDAASASKSAAALAASKESAVPLGDDVPFAPFSFLPADLPGRHAIMGERLKA